MTEPFHRKTAEGLSESNYAWSFALAVTAVLSLTACGGPLEDKSETQVDESAFTASCGVSGVLCARQPLYTSDIGMWYTLWWRRPNPNSTASPSSTSWEIASRYRPTAGNYTSAESNVFRQELAQFRSMKLDFILLDHTNGVGANGGELRDAGERVRDGLRYQREVQLAAAIGAPLWAGPTTNYAGQRQEANYVWNELLNPSTQVNSYQTRSGRPLVVNYTAAGRGDDWSDYRFEVGAASGSMSQTSYRQRQAGLHGWVSDLPSYRSRKSMVVQPGWGTSHLCVQRSRFPYHSCRAISRRGGAEFMDQWLRAIKQNPERIVIASWNDFAEETAIQPAVRLRTKPHHARALYGAERWADTYGTETPEFYYEIAKVYSLMRWGLMHGAYVKSESNPAVYRVSARGLEYQTSMPARHPVVVVPNNYLDQFPRVGSSGGGSTCNPPRTLSAGLFRVGSRTYYSNSAAYCYCDNSSPPTNRSVCGLPSGQANHGNCSGC